MRSVRHWLVLCANMPVDDRWLAHSWAAASIVASRASGGNPTAVRSALTSAKISSCTVAAVALAAAKVESSSDSTTTIAAPARAETALLALIRGAL